MSKLNHFYRHVQKSMTLCIILHNFIYFTSKNISFIGIFIIHLYRNLPKLQNEHFTRKIKDKFMKIILFKPVIHLKICLIILLRYRSLSRYIYIYNNIFKSYEFMIFTIKCTIIDMDRDLI